MARTLYIVLTGLFVTLSISNAYSQRIITGRVSEYGTDEPMPYVNIETPTGGTATNNKGEFAVKAKLRDQIIFSFIGFLSDTVTILDYNEPINIQLKTDERMLEDVIVYARRKKKRVPEIVQTTIRNVSVNNPDNLGEINFTAYNKVVIEYHFVKLDGADTVITRMERKNKDNHMLVTENVQKYSLRKGVVHKHQLVSNRVSGVKSTDVNIGFNQALPYHLYNPLVRIYEKNYINPLSAQGLISYHYKLLKTIKEENDTTFIIQYVPRRNDKTLLVGEFHIDSRSYALKYFQAKTAVVDILDFYIEQTYAWVDSNRLLPVENKYDVLAERVLNKRSGVFIKGYTKMYDYVPNYQDEDIEEMVAIDNLRIVPLTEKEQATYLKMDRIGQKYNFDWLMYAGDKLIRELALPIGIFDIDVTQLVGFNRHEGFRLGVPLYTNEKVHEKFSIGGYFGYGFKDKDIKYGAGLKIKPNKNNTISFKYKNDVIEQGFIPYLEEFHILSFRPYIIDSLNRTEAYQADYITKTPRIDGAIAVRTENITENIFSEGKENYRFNEVQITLKSSKIRNEVNLSKGKPKPVMSLNYIVGIGDYKYNMLHFSLQHKFVIQPLGKQIVNLKVGKIFSPQALPYVKLFSSFGANLGSTAIIDIFDTFITMPIYEYAATEFAILLYKYQFIKSIYETKFSAPRINFVHKMGYGNIDKKIYDVNTVVDSPIKKSFDKGYYESGILLENIIKVKYQRLFYVGFGASTYYTYGHNISHEDIKKNLAGRLWLTIEF